MKFPSCMIVAHRTNQSRLDKRIGCVSHCICTWY